MTEPGVHANTDSTQQTRRPQLTSAVVIVSTGVFLFGPILGAAFWFRSASPEPVLPVRFELRLAETTAGHNLTEAIVGSTGRTIYLHAAPIVTNVDVDTAFASYTYESPNDIGIGIKFHPTGGSKIWAAATQHAGRPVAVLLDGHVHSAPTIHQPLGDRVLIQGQFTNAEAERIAAGIMAGR